MCHAAPAPRAAPPSPREVLLELFDVLGRKEWRPEILACFCRDELLTTFLSGLRESAEEGRVALLEVLADADKVLVICEVRGATRSPRSAAFLCRVEGGVITEYWPIPEMTDLP